MRPAASELPPNDAEGWARQAWTLRYEDRARCRALSEQALEEAEVAGDGHTRGLALRNLGFCDYQASRYDEALKKLERALEIAREQDDLSLERDALTFIGNVYSAWGDLIAQAEYTQQSLQLNLRLRDEPAVVSNLNNLGVVYANQGRTDEALTLYQDALERALRLENVTLEVLSRSNLGESLNTLERLPEALEVLSIGLALAQKYHVEGYWAQTLVNLAETHTLLGNYPQALELLGQAEVRCTAEGSAEGLVYCRLGVGRIWLASAQPDAALPPLEDALSRAQAIGVKVLEQDCHQSLSQAHKALGHFEQALEHFEGFHRIQRQLSDERIEGRVRSLKVQLEQYRIRSEAEIERLRNVELVAVIAQLKGSNEEQQRLVAQLEAQSKILERLVLEDPLTGLYNRRHLEQVLFLEYERAQRAGKPLPLAMLDVDNFKVINDTFSHPVGDAVLVKLATLLRDALRASDLAARYGGEEFVVVLPRSTPEQALAVCERVREKVEQHAWSQIHPQLRVTVSIGLAWDTALEHPEKLLTQADDQMYEAKRLGKNRVCVSGVLE